MTQQTAGMPGHIIVGGRPVACAVPVEPWTVSKLGFPGLKPRRRTDLIVLHWTGGEGGAERVHRTLRERGLSVHFVIDQLGHITQHCDADTLAAHAKGMNDRSVGVEIVNRADANQNGMPPRPLLKERINGRDITYTAFLPAQVRAAISLCLSLCEAYGLPFDVPRIAPGGDVIARSATEAEFQAFRGIVGHFWRTHAGKSDCGLGLLRAIAAFDTRASIGLSGPAQ